MLKPSDIVEFRTPHFDEIGTTYTVLEVNGDRTKIQDLAINGVPIQSTFLGTSVVNTADLKRVEA